MKITMELWYTVCTMTERRHLNDLEVLSSATCPVKIYPNNDWVYIRESCEPSDTFSLEPGGRPIRVNLGVSPAVVSCGARSWDIYFSRGILRVIATDGSDSITLTQGHDPKAVAVRDGSFGLKTLETLDNIDIYAINNSIDVVAIQAR